MQQLKFSRLILAVALLTLSGEAYAYIDPGTTSVVLQTVLASVIGVFIGIKAFGARIALFFRKTFTKQDGE